eukprot:Platyproteum_vivax@DN7680_c0_g1_i14.p2
MPPPADESLLRRRTQADVDKVVEVTGVGTGVVDAGSNVSFTVPITTPTKAQIEAEVGLISFAVKDGNKVIYSDGKNPFRGAAWGGQAMLWLVSFVVWLSI